MLDSAPDLTDPALARGVNDALRSRHLYRSQLAELLDRCPTHPATKRLRRFVTATDGPTRSQLEDAFMAFCERYDLPRPQINTIVAGHEVDAYFEAEQLIVELDGWEYHSSRDAFESDRDRDADALALGIGTVRVTWERMQQTPDHEAARLHAILRSRREPAA